MERILTYAQKNFPAYKVIQLGWMIQIFYRGDVVVSISSNVIIFNDVVLEEKQLEAVLFIHKSLKLIEQEK